MTDDPFAEPRSRVGLEYVVLACAGGNGLRGSKGPHSYRHAPSAVDFGTYREFRPAEGVWRDLAETIVNSQMFGVVGDGIS